MHRPKLNVQSTVIHLIKSLRDIQGTQHSSRPTLGYVAQWLTIFRNVKMASRQPIPFLKPIAQNISHAYKFTYIV